MAGRPMISFMTMNSDKPASSGRGARILSFRRGRTAGPLQTHGQPPDLGKYERDDGPDDYRHRMLVNLAAFVFLVCLVGVGYWLADTMARQRKDQECVLSGRRTCSPAIVEIQRMGRSGPRE